MNRRTPGLPVHHQLLEFTQTQRPSSPWCHTAISSSVIPFSSCPQSLPASESFQWVNSSHEVAKVLEFQLQHHSLQRNPRADLLQNGLVGSPSSPNRLRQFSSVQFTRSVVSNFLWPHKSQHAKPPCPSPTPAVHSYSRPSSPWCHPVISSSVVPFSSCPQSLPASNFFPMNQLFAWGGKVLELQL